jgi:hypothetical protein
MISVVIPTLIRSDEQHETTLQCILAAKTNTQIPFELIIVETETNLLNHLCDIHVQEKKRTSSTRSLNRGMFCAKSDKVVILTNDVIVDENWLEHLLEPFSISDCGLSTLATDQFNHRKLNLINEGIWFGLAMIPKEEAWFDENYKNSWDDSDIIMRTYLKGKVMYRNYKSVVHHKIGMTLYSNPDHEALFEKNKAYFQKKYEAHQNHRMYRILTKGLIV